MLQHLPTEIVHRITDGLSCDDIDALSRIKQFNFLFHRITDDDSMNFYYFDDNSINIRRDFLKNAKRYTTARLYLIEISKPHEFDFVEFNIKFQNARKIICLINNDPEYSNDPGLYHLFQKKLLKQFRHSTNTKFKFINMKNIEIGSISNLDYSLISCDNISSISLKGCASFKESQYYRFRDIANFTIKDCADEVIENCDFELYPSNHLSVDFRDRNDGDNDFYINSDYGNPPIDMIIGLAKTVKLSNIDIIKDLKIGSSVKELTLAFADMGTLYIDQVHSLSVEKLTLIVNGSLLPAVREYKSTDTLKNLSIKDKYVQGVQEITHGNVLFNNIIPNFLPSITSLSLDLSNPRLLNGFQNYNLSNISEFRLMKRVASNEDLNWLRFTNLKSLSVGVSENCNVIPVLPFCETLEKLEIINELPRVNNLRMANNVKLNEVYPNLKELSVHNINNDELISNWFKNDEFIGLKSLRLLNVKNIPNLITFNQCEFPDLEFIEINGIINSMVFHELEISLNNSPQLKTIVVKLDELNEEFNHDLSIWENYLHELNLKIQDLKNLKNLIINNINSVYLRNSKSLETIIHGGDLDLQFLDADYLPNLQVLMYKNMNVGRPIQSVNFINPSCVKKVLKNSLHPLPDFFSG